MGPEVESKPVDDAFSLYRGTGGVEPGYKYCDPEASRNEVCFAYPEPSIRKIDSNNQFPTIRRVP